MDKLEEAFIDRGIKRGGILFLRPIDAMALITKCKTEKIPVDGIDGFKLTASTTQPFMEHSIILDRNNDPYEKGMRFLEKYIGSDFYFEVVYQLA